MLTDRLWEYQPGDQCTSVIRLTPATNSPSFSPLTVPFKCTNETPSCLFLCTQPWHPLYKSTRPPGLTLSGTPTCLDEFAPLGPPATLPPSLCVVTLSLGLECIINIVFPEPLFCSLLWTHLIILWKNTDGTQRSQAISKSLVAPSYTLWGPHLHPGISLPFSWSTCFQLSSWSSLLLASTVLGSWQLFYTLYSFSLNLKCFCWIKILKNQTILWS